MGDDRCLADEFHQVGGNFAEFRRVPDLGVSDAVDPDGVGIDQPLGMDQAVKTAPGRQQVLDLDTADLDQPVTLTGIQSGGFGVEDDFASHDP